MAYQKYIDALAIMEEVIAIAANVERDYNTVHPCHAKWDELYEFVYANFKDPSSMTINRKWHNDTKTWSEARELNDEDEAELADMREMFSLNHEELKQRLYEFPPTMLEQCFPVWMARYMLCHHNVPVLPTKLKTFLKFHKMYGYMIIYCNRNF